MWRILIVQMVRINARPANGATTIGVATGDVRFAEAASRRHMMWASSCMMMVEMVEVVCDVIVVCGAIRRCGV